MCFIFVELFSFSFSMRATCSITMCCCILHNARIQCIAFRWIRTNEHTLEIYFQIQIQIYLFGNLCTHFFGFILWLLLLAGAQEEEEEEEKLYSFHFEWNHACCKNAMLLYARIIRCGSWKKNSFRKKYMSWIHDWFNVRIWPTLYNKMIQMILLVWSRFASIAYLEMEKKKTFVGFFWFFLITHIHCSGYEYARCVWSLPHRNADKWIKWLIHQKLWRPRFSVAHKTQCAFNLPANIRRGWHVQSSEHFGWKFILSSNRIVFSFVFFFMLWRYDRSKFWWIAFMRERAKGTSISFFTLPRFHAWEPLCVVNSFRSSIQSKSYPTPLHLISVPFFCVLLFGASSQHITKLYKPRGNLPVQS